MRIMATGVDGRTSRACLMNSSSSSGRKALKRYWCGYDDADYPIPDWCLVPKPQ